MDKGTIVGALVGFSCVAIAILMHGKPSDFLDLPGALVAFGGSFSALFIFFPVRAVFGGFGMLKRCIFEKLPEPSVEIRRLTELALVARRDGMLALEDRLAEIHDPFLLRGLEMVIDGLPREKIEQTLQIELQYIEERHAMSKKMFDQLGASLPAFGMVGTLIGLIQMLHELDDPSNIGAGMAVALVTTFYGALAANLIFLPLAGKLEHRGKEETLLRELMIQGIVALVEGETPRAVESRLKAFLDPKTRQPLAA
ncbi:MAG TPA: motility protein A [Gemmataceae bacterium]|nr:motility protein A [Gemmataceae bacterium]